MLKGMLGFLGYAKAQWGNLRFVTPYLHTMNM